MPNITINQTIDDFVNHYDNLGYKPVSRCSFETPMGSGATFPFCCAMFYEDFYESKIKEVDSKKQVITQSCIRTDNYYRAGFSNKHLSYFRMLGLFDFNCRDSNEVVFQILDYLTETIQNDRLYVNLPENSSIGKDVGQICRIKGVRTTFIPKQKLLWNTNLNTEKYGVRVEFNYQKDDSEMELWNLSFIYDPDTNQRIIDSGICAERLNAAQNDLKSVFSCPDIKRQKENLSKLFIGNKNKRYFLNSFCENTGNSKINQYELNLLIDLSLTINALYEQGVKPASKKDKKGQHMRQLIKKFLANMFVFGYDYHRIGETIPYKFSEEIQYEVQLFDKALRIDSIDSYFQIERGIKEGKLSKLDKVNKAKSKELTCEKLVLQRINSYGKTSLEELKKLSNGMPLEIMVDWAVNSDISVDLCEDISTKDGLKQLCNRYRINKSLINRIKGDEK
ncbi:MAG: hypothetical protein ACOCQX_00875 [Candidatus Nanoarchaeia archaeon]